MTMSLGYTQKELLRLFTGEHPEFGSPNKFETLSLGEQDYLKVEHYFFFRDRILFRSLTPAPFGSSGFVLFSFTGFFAESDSAAAASFFFSAAGAPGSRDCNGITS